MTHENPTQNLTQKVGVKKCVLEPLLGQILSGIVDQNPTHFHKNH